MTDHTLRAVERLWRRLAQHVGCGRIMLTNDAGNAHTVQLSMGDGQLRDATPVLGVYGLVSHAPAGSDAVFLSVGGDRSNTVIVATGNQATRTRNTEAGAVGLSNGGQGITILLTSAGVHIDCGGKPLTVTNATKARFECPVESTAEITAMADGASVTLSGHRHAGGPKPDPHT